MVPVDPGTMHLKGNMFGHGFQIICGKIWKGMNSEMARDSWGAAERINRVISGNLIKEEWIYRSTWLYFENKHPAGVGTCLKNKYIRPLRSPIILSPCVCR